VGQTIAEQILAAHAGRDVVRPGEFVTVRVDLVMTNDLMGPPVFAQLRRLGVRRVFDPARVAVVPDHVVPARDLAAAALMQEVRRFVREQGIPHFWEVGETGIEHTLLPEQGLVAPGDLIVGSDSHTCTYGAFSAYGYGLGATDVAAVLATGETWVRVPETIRVVLRGPTAPCVTGKDVILEVIRRIGVAGGTLKCLEFAGDVGALNVDERMAVANMAVEAGAECGLFPTDEVLTAWLAPRLARPYRPMRSDPDAAVEREERLDLGALEPLVAAPFSPGNVHPVSALARRGIRIDQVYLGNCANGTLTDLRQAAAVLRDRRVARGVRMIVVPATPTIQRQAVREGLVETFLAAGAVVATPTCGACAGLHLGVLGEGEVCVSTTNRNFRGRMGHRTAEVYLANAYVAAASAVAGELADPRAVGVGVAG